VLNPSMGGAEGAFMAYHFDGLINPGDVIRVTFRGIEMGD